MIALFLLQHLVREVRPFPFQAFVRSLHPRRRRRIGELGLRLALQLRDDVIHVRRVIEDLDGGGRFDPLVRRLLCERLKGQATPHDGEQHTALEISHDVTSRMTSWLTSRLSPVAWAMTW